MGNAMQKIAMAGVAAVASTAIGGIVYRHIRYKRIPPKPLQDF